MIMQGIKISKRLASPKAQRPGVEPGCRVKLASRPGFPGVSDQPPESEVISLLIPQLEPIPGSRRDKQRRVGTRGLARFSHLPDLGYVALNHYYSRLWRVSAPDRLSNRFTMKHGVGVQR
jgi:hypothetical protein